MKMNSTKIFALICIGIAVIGLVLLITGVL
jgi:hypothetical protein